MRKNLSEEPATIWFVLTEEEWSKIRSEEFITACGGGTAEPGEVEWLQMQMSRRTTEFKNNIPSWGFFDPPFPSEIAVKMIVDLIHYDSLPRVIVSLTVSFDRVFLMPDSLWVCVFDRRYVGENSADDEMFDAKVYEHSSYGSKNLPLEYVEQIHQSWENFLDNKISYEHEEGVIVHALLDEVRLSDVSSALVLQRDFLKYPEYSGPDWLE